MADGPVPIVVFVLLAFAAFALPSALAFVLFGIVRQDTSPTETAVRPPVPRRPLRFAHGRERFANPRDRFGRTNRE